MPIEHITQSILVLRGQRVLLDAELAALYGVTTKRFNEQVRRNRERFPADFMFQLTDEEHAALRSHATLKLGRGQHRKYLPYAFTEHGAIIAATILNSPRAVEMRRLRGARVREAAGAPGLEQGARGDAALDHLKRMYGETIPAGNLHFIMGTMAAHPRTFIVIGLLRSTLDPDELARQGTLKF